MKCFILLALIAYAAAQQCGTTSSDPTRVVGGKVDGSSLSGHNSIVNGDSVQAHTIPWQVMIRAIMGGSYGLCGGSVIGQEWVVTAAHCLSPGAKYEMHFGAHAANGHEAGRVVCVASQVKGHTGYNKQTMANDIALLRIPSSCQGGKRFAYSHTIRAICLPSASENFNNPREFAMVSGWGTTSSGGSTASVLLKTVVKLHDLKQCEQLLRRPLAQGSLCGSGLKKNGRGTDSCQGDSGGPLALKTSKGWTLAGVVSWGYGCADRGKPGVYTHVPQFISWLQQNMR